MGVACLAERELSQTVCVGILFTSKCMGWQRKGPFLVNLGACVNACPCAAACTPAGAAYTAQSQVDAHNACASGVATWLVKCRDSLS